MGKHESDSDDYSSSDGDSDEEYDYEEEELQGWPYVKGTITHLVDGKPVTILMAVVTFYALFGDDFRLGFCPKEADTTFMVLSSISFFLFAIELVLNSLGKTECGPRNPAKGGWRERFFGIKGYLFSFFFLLDFVATLSLLPEITWMWGPITGECAVAPWAPLPCLIPWWLPGRVRFLDQAPRTRVPRRWRLHGQAVCHVQAARPAVSFVWFALCAS